MYFSKKVAALAVGLSSIAGAGLITVAAHAVTPLPPEQTALKSAGYTVNSTGWKFTKVDGACTVTVEVVGTKYYVLTSGKLHATMYPVQPSQVVNAAALMDANCQANS